MYQMSTSNKSTNILLIIIILLLSFLTLNFSLFTNVWAWEIMSNYIKGFIAVPADGSQWFNKNNLVWLDDSGKLPPEILPASAYSSLNGNIAIVKKKSECNGVFTYLLPREIPFIIDTREYESAVFDYLPSYQDLVNDLRNNEYYFWHIFRDLVFITYFYDLYFYTYGRNITLYYQNNYGFIIKDYPSTKFFLDDDLYFTYKEYNLYNLINKNIHVKKLNSSIQYDTIYGTYTYNFSWLSFVILLDENSSSGYSYILWTTFPKFQAFILDLYPKVIELNNENLIIHSEQLATIEYNTSTNSFIIKNEIWMFTNEVIYGNSKINFANIHIPNIRKILLSNPYWFCLE